MHISYEKPMNLSNHQLMFRAASKAGKPHVDDDQGQHLPSLQNQTHMYVQEHAACMHPMETP
jgi:hypothetical protein